MKYNLKKDNYKNFNVFKENVLEPRGYFIPFSSEEEMLKTDIRSERYNSSMVIPLSGEWKFKYYNKISDIPESFDTSVQKTDIIRVPDCWQFNGYEKPYYLNARYPFKCSPPDFPEDCPAGVYIKNFSVNKSDGNYILSFLGVASCYDVFLNGMYIGYSEGSHNTGEFEITKFVKDGENELVAVVHKWCTGTYLECQDMFRNNGIFRDVLLIHTDDNSIYDFEAKTTKKKDGSYILDVIPVFKITDEVTFAAELRNDNEIIASKSINVCPGKVDKLTFDVLDVEEWSAEIPKLYNLYLSLSKNGKIIEIIRKRIGFRNIEINENVFYLNGKKIKLLGVNHHDSNPKLGYVMSVEDMERDVRLFKEYNVNCVRTSHYPPDAVFLDLCDEYGIYAVDEADIECHGVNEIYRPNLIANNLMWKEHFWDRVYRMYQRDKNHPSITLWSLGNESGGYKCQDYCYDNLKKLTAVPVHYEGACRTKRFAYDAYSEMYTNPDKCKKIASGRGLPSRFYKKPFFICEYAHAMGVGAGELETYVNLFYSSDIMMGGCIWEFADHAVWHKDGPYEYTYGGDHGEWKHDSNFCVDGLFFPNREPHTGAYQMRACYRPVRALRKSDNEFEFVNHYYFKKAKMKVKYSVLNCGSEISKGELDIDIEPQKSCRAKIDFNVNNHTSVIFYYYSDEIEIAREQIIINEKYAPDDLTLKDIHAPEIDKSEDKIIVTFSGGNLLFNLTTGQIESYVYKSKELINQIPLGTKGFSPDLYRAPLDNDMNMKRLWHKHGLNSFVFKKIKSKYFVADNRVIIKVKFALKTPFVKSAGIFEIEYSINANGVISVEYEYKNLKFKLIPKMGICLEMPKTFNNIRYFGYDMESLSDFHEHSVIKINSLTVSQMKCNYIKPQESGMRFNTFWAEITDESGMGFKFENAVPFTFNASHYNALQCAKASHKDDLTEYNTTVVNIDGFEMGAGSNSCGPIPGEAHRKMSVRKYRGNFKVIPVGD
ncbi:MAG: hypothetical protein LUG21_08265 [Clostridiales bacterium]|nr:hypothetical protein [Clostridiales bacterium]